METKITRMLFVVSVGMLLTLWGSAQGQTGGYDAPFFQADFIEDLSDFSSGLVNPALLYRVNQYRLEGGFYRWEMDEAGSTTPLGYQEMSFLVPIRLNHTIGLSWIGTGSTIDRTTIDPNDATNTIRDLGEANFGDNWFVGHYSWRILPWFIAGTNLKLRYESKFGMSQQLAVGADVGVYINPMDHFRYGDLGFSLNLQDVVPSIPIWHDTGATLDQVGVTRVRAGVRYSGLNDKLVIDFEGVVDNALSDLYAGLLKADTVWTNATPDVTKAYELKKAFRLSAHVKWQFIPQVWLKVGWANNNIPYVGFNFNFIYPLPEMINYLNYDVHIGYALPIAGQEDERGLTMMHRLSTDFGPTREQRESKRLYDQLILAPMDAYNEAMRLYLAGKYWEAAFAFGKVVSLYPNFYLNDKAAYYMGDSYKRLYMNETARAVFKSALEEYTTSEMRSKYLYGLETIDYREGKYEDALKNHAFITNLYGESDIRPDADYVAGEIHFLRKNYNAAEQLLSRIKAGSPSYLYGQYTLAIINIENKKMEAAVGNLKSIIADTTQDPATQLLQDAANVKLGHAYYEQVELRNAVEAYKRVPEGSSYGDEALLGTAWSWIKVNQPAVCLQTVDRLIAAHPESPLVPEAYLLKGYGLMLQKKYQDAIDALDKCLDMTKTVKYVTEADLQARTQKFGQTTSEFAPTAEKVKKNALRKPTDKSIEERGAFKSEYDKFAKENRDFFNYTLLAQSHKKFFMRKDQVISDAEYAIAKATSLLKSGGQVRQIEDQKKKEEKINEEIEKKKKELQQIEKK
ncbi:MAG TPA: tetratricopeptide repeat protein [Chitinivibrionales bacterium]|nr:tetratricopeptide repeat protein [Chitinivibrionales bacterium]